MIGQDSRKYNYYVKYTALEESKIPIETIAPSGWSSTTEDHKPKSLTPTSETTTDNKKSWAEEVEEEDEARKNGSTIQISDLVDNEMGMFEAYVIFDGPMKGIYRKWAIAKQHIIDNKVRHKGYKTMKEAE